jgi:hypothetical protein
LGIDTDRSEKISTEQIALAGCHLTNHIGLKSLRTAEQQWSMELLDIFNAEKRACIIVTPSEISFVEHQKPASLRPFEAPGEP